MEDHWDLQSVVRGCYSTTTTTMAMDMMNPPPPQQALHDDFLFTTSTPFMDDLFETGAVFDELEQLYKPFYPIFNPVSVSEDQALVLEKVQAKREPLASGGSVSAASAHVAKYKRRKTQHKRVVLQVAAEDVSSDVWAWRKYGQKPIKDLPYPRSYYKCSSSKGCLARKQVEQSCSDPGMFIITYTAEHCHPQPTRRNSLAGTTRNRFSSAPKTTPATVDHHSDIDMPKPKISTSSPISPSVLSPSTPLSSTTQEDEFSQEVIKQESIEEEKGMVEDMMFLNNDFFVGLDGLDGFDGFDFL